MEICGCPAGTRSANRRRAVSARKRQFSVYVGGVTTPDRENDPLSAVLRYVDAFNSGDPQAMAATCADPMQILDGMSPHVWQGSTARVFSPA